MGDRLLTALSRQVRRSVPRQMNAETNCVRVAVSDGITDLEVDDWTHSVRCTDNWRERLQELAGKAMIRAQHRPLCPACSSGGSERVPLLVRTSLSIYLKA